MKRKTLSLLLALLLCLPLAGPARADDEADVQAPEDAAATLPAGEQTTIGSAEELRAIADDPGGSYLLTANINMKDEPWTPIAFSGTLDGNGYAIYNLTVTAPGAERCVTVDGNKKEYDTVFAGLFSAVKNATITRLSLKNVRVNVTTDENCFAGLLAGYAENSAVTDCDLQGAIELHTTNYMVGVGGLAGFGRLLDAQRCRVDTTLIHVDESSGIHCEQFTGGIIGCGYAGVLDCTVDIAGYTSCRGYVHDGGLVGMHYQYEQYDGMTYVDLADSGNSVSGFITFFEDNADRRAYCYAYCGENMDYTFSPAETENTQSFERREVYDYSAPLYPHSNCGSTDFIESVTQHTCTEWGYTTYTCVACDYRYQDDFTAPDHYPGDWQITREATFTESGERAIYCELCGALLAVEEIAPHVAGEWVTTAEPGYDLPGRREQRCLDCGELLAEEEIPALVRSQSITLSAETLSLHYRGNTVLSASVSPEDAYNKTVTWSSSAPDIISVDENGLVRALDRGSAVITCTAADGGAVATCTVTSGYSPVQWIIVVLLFGWLWY